MAVGLVIVSHSARLAEGVVELAGQMAQGRATLIAAGGADDGSLGTSFTRVSQAIAAADAASGAAGVIVLADLGSAAIVAAMALEELPPERRARVRLANAPLVEGAVVAAVEASIGATLDEVVSAAEGALTLGKITKGA